MDRQAYFKKLSFLVSWRLPEPEAREVLCDYQELLFQQPTEDGTALIRDLGTPRQAARLLTEAKEYRRWLTAFAVMTICLVIPEFLLLRANFVHDPLGFLYALFALGLAVCFLWFRPRRKAEKSGLPKGLLPLLLGSLVIWAAAGVLTVSGANGAWTSLPLKWYGPMIQAVLWCVGTAAAAFGLLGLVKARISDRRWRALYVLGLTILTECLLVTAVLHSLWGADFSSGWWIPYAIHLGVIGGLGLIATGVSLC